MNPDTGEIRRLREILGASQIAMSGLGRAAQQSAASAAGFSVALTDRQAAALERMPPAERVVAYRESRPPFKKRKKQSR